MTGFSLSLMKMFACQKCEKKVLESIKTGLQPVGHREQPGDFAYASSSSPLQYA